MFADLSKMRNRPEPFSAYTTDVLWTDDHLSQQMLKYHLDQETDLASRRLSTIDSIVEWIEHVFGLNSKRVCDLGCGPGLYAQRFARRGAEVTGLDFSSNSITHAREKASKAGFKIDYLVANYLKDSLPTEQDLVTMIYCDICTLSREQRRSIYDKVRNTLVPGGAFVFDVMSAKAFSARQEDINISHCPEGGFWSVDPYFAFQNTFKYEDERLVLDKHTIVEANRTWEVFNWLQYFDEVDLADELMQSGFKITQTVPDFTNPNKTMAGDVLGIVASPVS